MKAATKKVPARKAAKKTIGEGDYAASRAFLKDEAGFVEKNKAKIPAMGKAAEARRWLDKAANWLDQQEGQMPLDERMGSHLHNWLEAQVLRQEASTLLR